MTYKPPQPHKFYRREYGSREQYAKLLSFSRKYNWWSVEKFIIGEECKYESDAAEGMGKDDKWQPISETDYYCALGKLGRILTDKAATQIVETAKPAPELSGFRKVVCELLGIKGVPDETPASEDNED